jgi:hypothetical protein
MAFNEWIHRWGLIEYKDPIRIFTWSNDQNAPIMARLDRFLATIEWDIKYPLAKLDVPPRSVSDHNPLQMTFGAKTGNKESLARHGGVS